MILLINQILLSVICSCDAQHEDSWMNLQISSFINLAEHTAALTLIVQNEC